MGSFSAMWAEKAARQGIQVEWIDESLFHQDLQPGDGYVHKELSTGAAVPLRWRWSASPPRCQWGE